MIAATLLEKNGSVQKTIRSGVFDIGYRTDGRGTPLLLLGGWSMKADQWWESGYVDALRDQFAVIAGDRIGHGQSDKPHDASAYEESLVIRDLVAILDAEGVDRALVWGFSMGAATAAELATRHPERVFALVCAGGGPFPAAPDHEERILNLSEAVATVAGFADMMRAFGVDDEGIAEIEGRNDLVALSLSLRATAHWSPAAAGIRCPMMWYVGSEDLGGFCPADLELADRHGFEAFEIEGATHASSFTDAAIPLASVIPFLQRHADPLGER